MGSFIKRPSLVSKIYGFFVASEVSDAVANRVEIEELGASIFAEFLVEAPCVGFEALLKRNPLGVQGIEPRITDEQQQDS